VPLVCGVTRVCAQAVAAITGKKKARIAIQDIIAVGVGRA
jgi:hypothetical protein